MSRLTRDGTAEPVTRDQILRRERGQVKNIHFPSADHEQDWQPYPVVPHSCYNTCDQKKMEDKVRCSAVRGAVTLTESSRTGNYFKVATTVIGAEPVPRCVCPS